MTSSWTRAHTFDRYFSDSVPRAEQHPVPNLPQDDDEQPPWRPKGQPYDDWTPATEAAERSAEIAAASTDDLTELNAALAAGMVVNRDTDRANGEEFARMWGHGARWTPQTNWLLYSQDGRWVPDEGLVRYQCVDRVAQELKNLAAGGVGSTAVGEDFVKTLRARARRLECVPGADSALKFAAVVLELPSVRLMDANPMLINFPNGTYDAASDVLRPHNPNDLITRLCPTEWHPDARDEVWDRVLEELFNDDSPDRDCKMTYLQRFAGYTLLGLSGEKQIMVPYGPRDTAKSTVTEALSRAIGDVDDGGYSTTWDALVVQAGNTVNRDEKLNKARAARMVVTGELEKGARMADNFVKRYSGGTPSTPARSTAARTPTGRRASSGCPPTTSRAAPTRPCRGGSACCRSAMSPPRSTARSRSTSTATRVPTVPCWPGRWPAFVSTSTPRRAA